MFPPNPSTELYTLGKGRLYAAEWSGGSAGEYFDLGNAPEVKIAIAIEELPHYSSRSQSRNKDKIAVLEKGYTVNFSLDEKSEQNLEIFLMGSVSGGRVHALTSTDKEYALKFVADNPEGPNDTWEFWRGKIKPSGEASLISDDWMTLPYVMEGLSDTTNHATSPFFDVYGTTTTTTTTTSSTTTTTTAP